jgi:hypothetical protein
VYNSPRYAHKVYDSSRRNRVSLRNFLHRPSEKSIRAAEATIIHAAVRYGRGRRRHWVNHRQVRGIHRRRHNSGIANLVGLAGSFVHPPARPRTRFRPNQTKRLPTPNERNFLRTQAESTRHHHPRLRRRSLVGVLLGFQRQITKGRPAFDHPRARNPNLPQNAGHLAHHPCPLLRHARPPTRPRFLNAIDRFCGKSFYRSYDP